MKFGGVVNGSFCFSSGFTSSVVVVVDDDDDDDGDDDVSLFDFSSLGLRKMQRESNSVFVYFTYGKRKSIKNHKKFGIFLFVVADLTKKLNSFWNSLYITTGGRSFTQ